MQVWGSASVVGFGVDDLHRQSDEELMVHDTPV